MEITEHAEQRMEERNISRLDVEHVIATAHTRTAQPWGTTLHHGIALDDRAIVVCTESEDWDVIVTIYRPDEV
ncbi:DUF4258 domain-containing protein [Patulibacter brassicae]|jgi:hypothetical protein|uniref:DUF4258 domain-containing protein n=1 Tax=Patulibacter brassicae TaxID=1705717 RepID=A0ABU4VL69_9ACTN|nr:DUF4258 domain-containing protein [Patulibacter brassicae]MDX8152589.1 DUF4258 domain-containing protein [Patulibacter brassicae]